MLWIFGLCKGTREVVDILTKVLIEIIPAIRNALSSWFSEVKAIIDDDSAARYALIRISRVRHSNRDMKRADSLCCHDCSNGGFCLGAGSE